MTSLAPSTARKKDGDGKGGTSNAATGQQNITADPSTGAPPAEKLKRIGDWIFGETLGQGSFGKVKLAHHAKTKEKVAIKIVDKSGIANVEDVERVYRETFILTTLKHQNIIKLFEVLDTPKSIMLVMEYAGGGELFSYVSQKHRLGELESCRLFQQIIAGVEYCHRAKIIHRDLKLENILLDTSGRVKIADFGLSNSIKFGQKMDTSCGTPSYTCPEQIMGRRYIGNPADVWSLGCILFAMISGFLPFESTSIPALFKKIKSRSFRFPDYMSKEAQDLIGSMLTVDPEKRSTIAELRNHPWFMMEYTELADIIEAQKPVTSEMVSEARALCMAVGDESSNNSTSGTNNPSSNPSGRPGGTTTGNNKYTTGTTGHGHKTSTSSSTGGGIDVTQSSKSSTGADADEKDGAASPISHHHTGSNGPVLPTGSASSGQAMGVRPRERGNGIGNGHSNSSGGGGGGGGNSGGSGGGGGSSGGGGTSGGGASKPSTAKGGFRDRSGRSSPPTHTSSSGASNHTKRPGHATSGAMSIFDKLSVRTSTQQHPLDGAGVPQNSSSQQQGRYPRFGHNPSHSDANSGGVRFPPIGGGSSPGGSPLPSDLPTGAGGRKTRPSITAHSHDAPPSSGTLVSSAGGSARPTRRPSEFGASIPSYMQPTENAQNHLLASEREEREKQEEAGTPGGRVRGRSSVISHVSSPQSVGGGGGGGGGGKGRLDRLDEDAGGHHLPLPTNNGERGGRPSVIKTPRARELGGTTPAYMLETNSSRQRGSIKPTQDL